MIRQISLLGLALSARCTAAADIDVYVASVGATPAYRAEQIAASIFRSAGVVVAWHTWKPRATISSLAVRVDLEERTPVDYLPEALAVAYPFADRSKCITVFCDRIRGRAKGDLVLQSALLAHVLVHEITHLIQGTDRHSETGIMKAQWDQTDREQMIRAPLSFTDEDLLLIHQALARASAGKR